MLKRDGYQMMAAAFEVYNVQGYGMAEAVYQQSLEIELSERKIPFQTFQQFEVFCNKDRKLSAAYRPDLVVFDRIMVELKAVKMLTSEHQAQLFNYLRVSGQPVGYLLNYGAPSKLEWQRLIVCD